MKSAAGFASLKARLAGWEPNPVVVKELRQSVRSWSFVAMLLLFLVVLFATSVIFLVFQALGQSDNIRIGADIFQVFSVILTCASLFFIPLYVGVRLAAERQEHNLDLFYISTLTPQRIIRGKFFCGVYLAVLFFSASIPFMVFTNLLRGIDLPSIAFVMGCLFLVVCASVQVAIFLACLPVSKFMKILFALGSIFIIFPIIIGIVGISSELLSMGVGSMFTNSDVLAGLLTFVGLLIAGGSFLHVLSVALITPVSANRALPVRLFITGVWIAGGLGCLAWAWKESSAEIMVPWGICSFILLTAALAVVICGIDDVSHRVRRTIPVSPLKRVFAFLFYNGAPGGILWVAILMSTTLVVVSMAVRQRWFMPTGVVPAGEYFMQFESMSVAVILYVFDYALLGLFLHRRFFPKRSPKLAGIFAVLLAGGWALLPNIALFFANQLSWASLNRTQLGNLFNVMATKSESGVRTHLIFAAASLVVLIVINAPWFIRQVRQFRPPDRPAAVPARAGSEPLVPDTTA